MKPILFILTLVLLFVSCDRTLPVKHEETIAISRGSCYEELILLEHAEGRDTLCHVHVPVNEGPVFIRLHANCNMGITAGLSGLNARGNSAHVVVQYGGAAKGLQFPKKVRLQTDGKQKLVLTNISRRAATRSTSGLAFFFHPRDRWLLEDFKREDDDIRLLRELVLESLSAAPEDGSDFVFQQIYSTPAESTIYSARIDDN